MKSKLKIIFAMVAFGTIAIFVKNISLSTGEIALLRAVIASIAIAFYKLISGKKIIFSEIKKDLPVLFISGGAMGFNWILLFQAYKHTTVSIATLSYYFAPVIVMIVCPILFKEKLSAKQLLCFIMASIGLIMVIGVDVEGAGDNQLGIGFGLGAAALYATVVILNKYVKKATGIDRTLIQFLAAIIVLTPYVCVTTGINIGDLDSISAVMNLLILGFFHTGVCYILYFSSLRDLKGQEAAILSYIDPLVAIIVSVTILQESITLIQILGGLMILGFTLLNEFEVNLYIKVRKLIRREINNG